VEQEHTPAGINQPIHNNQPKKYPIGRLFIVGAALAVMFGVGWLVGSDRVSVNDPGFSQSSDSEVSTTGIDEIYNELLKNYDGDIDAQELSEGLKRGAVAAVGDNFTEYLSPQETEEFNASLDGTFEGIGAELGKEGNFVIIVAPLKGAPAEAAGVRSQDIIAEIDGEDAIDITISEAVNRIRGEKGTDVTLTLIRAGERIETTITRGTIDIASVEWRVEENIGIIEISRFGTDTGVLVRQAATEFVQQGIYKVVLDMRGNPGGLLDQAVNVSDIWLPRGAIILEEKKDDKVIKSFSSNNDPLLRDVETVVLINQGSASASEIVAGALSDNNAATLVGATSFGKGSVQRIIDLRSGGSLKVTIARWFTPAGKNIDKEGITPSIEVEVTAENVENDEDPQLSRAIEELNN